jgi:hypothetical protein
VSTWPVFVEHWQLECCGDAFALGDEVAWTLVLATDRGSAISPEMLVEAAIELGGHATTDGGTTGAIVHVAGEFDAWLAGDPTVVGAGKARGVLVEEHHGDVPAALVPVRGVVRRIRLVTEDFRNVSDRTWEHVAGTATYEDLERSPRGFGSGLDSDGPVRRGRTGLLVDLELV